MPIPNYLAISACEKAGGEYDSVKLSCIIPNTVTNPIPIPESDESESEAGPPYAIIGTIVFAMMIIIPAIIKKSRKKKSKEIVINKKKDREKEFERQKAIRKAKEEKNRIEDQKIEDQRKRKLKEKKKIDDDFEKQKQLWIESEAKKAEQKIIEDEKIEKEVKNIDSKPEKPGGLLETYREVADLEKASKYDEALEICNNYLKINPNDQMMIEIKIRILEGLEEFKEILPLYDILSELTPRSRYWHLKSKAEILIKMGQYPEAVQLCDESLKLKFKEYTVNTRDRAQSYADKPETAENIEKTPSVQTTIPHIKITASTNIASAGYDESQKMLEILFTSKTIYQFFEIPKELFLKLMDSESKGTFFHEHIKDRFQYQISVKNEITGKESVKLEHFEGDKFFDVKKLEKEIPAKYMSSDWRKADYFYSVEKYEEALYFYNKAMEGTRTYSTGETVQNEDDHQFNYGKARTLFHLDRFEESIECYDKIIIRFHTHSNFWHADVGKGDSLAALGRFDEAKKCYKDALKAPGYAHYKILEKINNLSEINHDADSSKDIVQKKVKNSNDNKTGVVDESEKEFERLRNITEKIYSLRKTDRFEEILNLCNEYLQTSPDSETTIQKKIEILDILERYEEILPLYDQLSKLTPRTKFYQLKCKAEILIKMKQCAKAIRLCDESLELKSKDYTTETRNQAQFYLDNPELLGKEGQNPTTSPTMLHTKVISREIESVGYDESKKLLEIWFRRSNIYHYFDIAKPTYLELIKSQSPEGYFRQNILNKCEYKKMNSEIFELKVTETINQNEEHAKETIPDKQISARSLTENFKKLKKS
ncbi:MAG: KTSC domain-containing protein, partial [Candidatus Nitrosopelagicus sp.]|nr:KTSC domain-containing protein [Candidatus Nitrosopelagicus sp.]